MTETLGFDDKSIQAPLRFKKYKAKQGRTDRILLFEATAITDNIHFKKGYGYFSCLGTDCPACEAAKLDPKAKLGASRRFGTVILVYDTSDSGELKTPFNIEPFLFLFGIATYVDIRRVRDEWSDEIFKRDLIINCDNDQFQNLKFSIAKDCKLKLQPDAAEWIQKLKEARKTMDVSKALSPQVDRATMEGILSGKIQKTLRKNPNGETRSSFASSEAAGKSLIDDLAG